jgi:uncharacterized protein
VDNGRSLTFGQAGRPGGRSRLGLVLVAALLLGFTATASAQAQEPPSEGPFVSHDERFQASDGVELMVRVGGRGPLVDGHLPARPVIIELSPYGPGCCPEHGGPAYNHVQVHLRGTGASGGTFDSLGPRAQQDLAEVLDWACTQPWSDGRLGLWGFSASAIVVYNSLHQELPCLRTAVLGSGTYELYRDLLYPGGIPNALPALGVLGLITAPALAELPGRMAQDPASTVDLGRGLAGSAVDFQLHPTLDDYWAERGFRGDANEVPILMVNGFFDVESRGAFEAYQALRDAGAHLYVVGAHDGVPAGTPGPGEVTRQWFDQHLRGVESGVLEDPRVHLWLADGDRARMLAGEHLALTAPDWPVPGTEWVPLHLTPDRSGSSSTVNDGSLALRAPASPSTTPHVPIPSPFTATDPYTTSLLGVFDGSSELTTMDLPETLGLAFTTAPLEEDVLLAGPANVEVVLTSAVPEQDLWAVISDVWPDGSVHPMGAGRLRTSFPDLVPDRSRLDADGNVVQPLNDVSAKRVVPPAQEHRYHLEVWPIGNRFKAEHRIRVHLVGASTTHMPTTTGPNLVRLGGPDGGSLVRLPVLPGSDLRGALGEPTPEQPEDPTDPDGPTRPGGGRPDGAGPPADRGGPPHGGTPPHGGRGAPAAPGQPHGILASAAGHTSVPAGAALLAAVASLGLVAGVRRRRDAGGRAVTT